MVFGGAFWNLAIVLVTAGGGVWFSRSARGVPQRDPRLSGLDVLDERYARGELDRTEYLHRQRGILCRDT